MKKGFTLVEVLAVIIIMGILAVIVAPVIQKNIFSNSDTALLIDEKNIIKAAKDWSLEHIDMLPINGNYIKVKLSELKNGYLPLNIKNPKSGDILSNETYVKITENNDNYDYQVYFYDIPNEIYLGNQISFNGNFLTEEINLSSVVSDYGITVSDSYGNSLQYSKQYILNNNEVSNIDTSKKNTYSIVYTVLYNNNIYKAVKTIIIK